MQAHKLPPFGGQLHVQDNWVRQLQTASEGSNAIELAWRKRCSAGGVIRCLCHDCTGIVLDLERVRPGLSDEGISRAQLVLKQDYFAITTARKI